MEHFDILIVSSLWSLQEPRTLDYIALQHKKCHLLQVAAELVSWST